MKIYNMGTGGLWIGILVVLFFVITIFTLSGFLLGTPLGLAILTFMVIRHFYKKHQFKKYQEPKADFRTWDEPSESSKEESFSDDFSSKYKQAEQDIKIFSSDDRSNAVDVEFKEL